MSKAWYLIFIAWIISLIAMLGSLFFSIIMEFTPCTLCWYQRIAMYPLVVTILIDLLSFPKVNFKYSFPLIFIGLFFSIYHNLIHYDIIPTSISPCVSGIPCSTKYIDIFGFITIPMLSFIAFVIIGISLLMATYVKKENNES
jgi:disulfide bond formation protein DsbB